VNLTGFFFGSALLTQSPLRTCTGVCTDPCMPGDRTRHVQQDSERLKSATALKLVRPLPIQAFVDTHTTTRRMDPRPLQGAEKPSAVTNLPPFPTVAMKIMQLLSTEDTSMRELAGLITADPAFSTEILILANSPLFAFRTEIKSILQATALLGLQRVKALALTVGIKGYLADSLKIPVLRACWQHSLACAF